MGTAVANFALAQVSTGYDAAAVSITVATGQGSRFPSVYPYPIVWWDATTYVNPALDPNAEIVKVTGKAGDVFTIVRAQEGTVATVKNVGGKTYQVVEAITAAMWTELQRRALTQSHRGLELKRHPNQAAAPYTVLFNADAIVMSDGEEVQGWANIEASMIVSGAGGLDTGAEAANSWYEVHAIYNGVTKAALLHKAKNLQIGAVYFTGDDTSQGLRSAVDNSHNKLTQSFTFSFAGPMEFVDVLLLKVGSPIGQYWFTLESDSGGAPSGTVLATSDFMDAQRLLTGAVQVRIPFRTPYSVSVATTYHLVMQGDYTVNASNYVAWRMDTSTGYAGGQAGTYDSDAGGVWTMSGANDMQFACYLSVDDTPVTLPAGYKSAFLGYVVNDGSSSFRPFHQVGRRVFCGYSTDWRISNAFTGTTATLFDARTYLPPVPVVVNFAIYNGTASNNAIGDTRATDLVAAIAGGGIVGAVTNANNTTWPTVFSPIALDKTQGFVIVIAGGTASVYIVGFEF